MTNVLVPYDFSKQARQALEFTIQLAGKLDNIHVEVLHILEIPTSTSFGGMGAGEMIPEIENQLFFTELTEQRKKQLKSLEEKYSNKNFNFNTKLKFGNAFQRISESINEENPDLVVMGSKGSSGIEEVLIGSNTEKVVRTAKCPVVTIKDTTDPAKIKKIVFASDFKEDSDEIAARIKRLQHLFNAELYFVLVNTPGNFESSRESFMRIKLFAKKYGFENIKAEIYNNLTEESGIIEFAEDVNADMIAMSTHGRTGFLHLITGSIAEDVVNHAKRPVWTFHTK